MCKNYDRIDNIHSNIVRLKHKNGFIEAGFGKKTLVNSLIGINNEYEYSYELEKLQKIVRAAEKPDIVSDLSTIRVKKENSLWYKIANQTEFVSGSLPIYLVKSQNNCIDEKELLDIIIEQMENGVGLITIHPTANKEIFEKSRKRKVPITSRGGGIVIKDCIARNFTEQNVYLKILSQIMLHARKNNVVISIGTTFRSSNIFDCNDDAQKMEIKMQIKLAELIAEQNIGVVIESPGHARPRDIIEISSFLKKAGFPVMPLGPIPTDIAIGMDHISGAIGATIMGLEGCANIITTVTREEHTGGRPQIDSIIESIKAAKVAAHIIDIHNINDTNMDMIIADERAEFRTCIIGSGSKYCDRCREMCPLSIR